MKQMLISLGAVLAAAGLWTHSQSAPQKADNDSVEARPKARHSAGTAEGFITDFERARKEAATLKRPIFALFTGSDWCPLCAKLQEQIINTDAFRKYAAANLVLFEADFPRQRQLSEELRKQNEALAEKYEIAGFPTVLLLDASGAIKATTGYRLEDAESYVAELKRAVELGEAQGSSGPPLVCGYAAKQRIDYQSVAPGGFEAMLGLEEYVRQSGLEHNLVELVRARVSQINGCAYCLDMHTKDARANAETEQRLFLLPVWREAPCYTDRERAALAWAEAVTVISQNEVPDKLYTEMRRYFSEKELVDLTFAIVSINGWNRLSVTTRAPVGTYQPAAAKSQ